MKKMIIVIFSIIISTLSLNAQQTDEQFYYYRGEKIYLEIDFFRVLVISEGTLAESNIQSAIATTANIEYSRKSVTQQNVISDDNMLQSENNMEIFMSEIRFFSNEMTSVNYFEIIQNLQAETNIIKVSPSYLINNQRLNFSHNFYVKLHDVNDMQLLSAMAAEYSIQILGYNEYMPLWITLSCTKQTPMSAIEAANLFYESQLFEYAEPEILYHDLQLSNDPYYNNQWGLKNTGQYGGVPTIDIHAEDAWTVTTGSPDIKVAVFDHGFEMNHPDLINNVYSTGYDAKTNTTPAQVRGEHGTACAGIIGAQQNNSEGISGIAPNSKLASISINLDWADTPQQLANGFNWARQNGIDVISNSWGGYAPSSIIDDAITAALTQGRNGKGMVVVFASGNENNTAIRYPGNSNPDILVVGAISPCGQRKSPSSCDGVTNWGSCYGTQLDVVAPGVLIPTTDRQGTAGYDTNSGTSGDYYNKFGGTSSACPHVAGVAALILSVNPNLTVQNVTDIIESTAQKVNQGTGTGQYNYQTSASHPNGTWHQEMGYGLVDAYAAVSAACYTSAISDTVSGNTTWADERSVNANTVIPSGVILTITGTVKFTPGVAIIVNPGGKLVLNGATLTNACSNQLWEGIRVEGNTNQRQLAQYQGTVEVTNSLIENSRGAISTATYDYNAPNYYSLFGGIIKASNSTFKNNIRSIAFNSYTNHYANGDIADNVSYINNCTFIVNNDNLFAYNVDADFNSHVLLRDASLLSAYKSTIRVLPTILSIATNLIIY
jgi:subtilisin family serine protease